MKNQIIKYLDKYNFDIRVSKDARFMDQKVTPDVLCIVADCIINYIDNTSNKEFTSSGIWKYDYSNENVMDIFGKTNVNNPKAKNEYNKFFQQPLKALSYAKILNERKVGNTIYFSIENYKILEYISYKEKHSLEFLNIYLEKVLKDSEIWYMFDKFFNDNTKDNFDILKSKYENFIIRNTPKNGKTEVRRIFTKIINPLSFMRKKHATKKGRFSKDIISRDKLMYNRKNWRDLSKKKAETREEFEMRIGMEKNKQNAYVKYTLNKAKNIIKKLHFPESEIQDEFSVGDARDIHHIFMKSQYPEISTYIENLILLTPTQHFTKAHPNDTNIINKYYKLLCLLAKSDSIEKYNYIYSKEDFLYVLKIGLKQNFSNNIEFGELKTKLVELYNIA